MAHPRHRASPPPGGANSAAANGAVPPAGSAAQCAPGTESEANSLVRRVLVTLLWFFHFSYTFLLLCRRARSEWRLAKRTGVRATVKRAWRPLYRRLRCRMGAEVPVATELRTEDFSRLVAHLAFSLDPALLRPAGTVAAAATLVGATRKEAAPASVATSLLSTCLQLPLAELTLFDDDEALSRSWPLTGVLLAQQQADAAIEVDVGTAEATQASVLILVLQGAPTAASLAAAAAAESGGVRGRFVPASAVPSLLPGEVLLVHRGLLCVADASQFLSGDVDDDEDSVDFVVDTSRPGMVFSPPKRSPSPDASAAASAAQRDPASQWRTRVAHFVARRMRTDAAAAGLSPAASAPAAAVRLLSFLGTQHGQRAVARAVLTAPDANASAAASDSASSLPSSVNSAKAAASVPSQALRMHLQRSVLPLPLSEPELLISVSRAHRDGERSLHAFPPWLLRVAEMGFVNGVTEMTHGPQLEEQLHLFARTVQRSGT